MPDFTASLERCGRLRSKATHVVLAGCWKNSNDFRARADGFGEIEGTQIGNVSGLTDLLTDHAIASHALGTQNRELLVGVGI